ncbi:hypothetical protein VTP01DRAFT_9381 [Rhizomucor pusillus]|uniref:uncharacterized protein n=1 Tax=Rhizomucor pusillus TaxID=4840 RepID=UPI0037432504
MWGAYQRVLARRPILVQSLTTVFLFGAGDVLAQQGVERRGLEQHEISRTFRMAAFGGTFAGPALSIWYRFLEKNIKATTPLAGLVKKVAADQLLSAPIFIGVFFTVQGLFEGKPVNEIKEKLQNGYTSALFANYKLWPAVQFINFYYTPLNYRLMVTNLVALGWNAYLSTVNQQASSASEVVLKEEPVAVPA